MTRIISLVLVALATWTIGCAGDTSAPLNSIDADFFQEDAEIPPGADDPHPPEPDDVSTPLPKPDVVVDPCADYRDWIKEGVTYLCKGACGKGSCIPYFTTDGGVCGVKCDPEFYEYADRLGPGDGHTFIYSIPAYPDCAITCNPLQ